MPRPRWRIRRWVYLSLLVLAPLLYFSDATRMKFMLGDGDAFVQYLPYWQYAAEEWRRLTPPVVDPLQAQEAGHPFRHRRGKACGSLSRRGHALPELDGQNHWGKLMENFLTGGPILSEMETRKVHSPDWAGKEILLLRTCSDRALARILDSLRTHFAGARVTLLTSSLQPSPPGSFEACHVHHGGRRALLAWVRARRWEVVAIPWTGEPILPRWKTILPWLARAQHRVVFNEYGGFFRLGRSGLRTWARHLRWRLRRPPAPLLSGIRLRAPIELVVGPLAVLRMAVRVPVLLGFVGVRRVVAALLRRRGRRPAAP